MALTRDLEYVLDRTGPLWEDLRGQRLFITGGTGFFGCWLLESFAWANARLRLGASAVVLTRNPQAFRQKAPHLSANPDFRFLEGDVRTFPFPDGHFPFVIHAATEASVRQAREAPMDMLSTIVEGTRHTLEFARECGARKFLLTSSGAVYGRQPRELSRVPESFTGTPDPAAAGSVYGEGKRLAETLCGIYSQDSVLECKIARCFAFVGPYLPLDIHFAIGNFIRDAMSGGPIQVNGDGTAVRSYLYAADLAVWLWTILFKAPAMRPYNVGSEDSMTIRQLARETAGALDPRVEVVVAGEPVPGAAPDRYVPSTQAAREELDLQQCIGLREAIRRTAEWYGHRIAERDETD